MILIICIYPEPNFPIVNTNCFEIKCEFCLLDQVTDIEYFFKLTRWQETVDKHEINTCRLISYNHRQVPKEVSIFYFKNRATDYFLTYENAKLNILFLRVHLHVCYGAYLSKSSTSISNISVTLCS